jgi:3-oxoacyl-[acyl-carrier protein] reductase
VQSVRQAGEQIKAWEADMADPAIITQLFDRMEETFGPVDVLVNNAARCVPDTFIPPSQPEPTAHTPIGSRTRTITEEYHDQNFAVNSRAVALMTAEYARRHIERGARWGRIINVIADRASYSPSEISYAASRHALESYTCSAARQLGKYGITVNVMSLGPVQTGWMTPEFEEEQKRRIPLQRVGQPEDVADAIVFLASEQARWVTGQILYVSGGSRAPL